MLAGLYTHVVDLASGNQANYYFEGGIKSLVTHLNHNKKSLHDVIYIQGQAADLELPVGVEVALQYNDSFSETIETFANVIKTVDGGTHLTGFRIALTKSINNYAKKILSEKDLKESLSGDDTKEGLAAIIYIKMPATNLQFEGQTKGKLGNSEVQPIVQQTVGEFLDVFFDLS